MDAPSELLFLMWGEVTHWGPGAKGAVVEGAFVTQLGLEREKVGEGRGPRTFPNHRYPVKQQVHGE
jgi:hypothetical protein